MSNSQNGEMDAATLDEQHAQTELLQSIERRLELPIPVRVQEPIRVTVDKVSKTSLADGAATEAKQDVGNTSLASIDTKLTNPIPVTVGALPLPAGAATSALQTTGNTSLASIDGKTPALVGGRQPVDGSGVTQPVSAVALPLPAGAATSALQTTGNTSLASIDAGIPATLGQTTMANSMPVVLASDQSVIAAGPKSSAGAATTVSVTSASTQLLAANANRKGFIIVNVGANICYIGLGFTPTTTSYSRAINTTIQADTWEVFGHAYTGAINAIRSSGSTNVVITELT